MHVVDGQGAPKTLLQGSEATFAASMVPPEGLWLTYRSTETGRTEVYIASFVSQTGRQNPGFGYGGRSTSLVLGNAFFFMAKTAITEDSAAVLDRLASAGVSVLWEGDGDVGSLPFAGEGEASFGTGDGQMLFVPIKSFRIFSPQKRPA